MTKNTMNITIRDIAKECGVSAYTVSSVLHSKKDVGDKTRKRVLSAIKRMKYDPLKNMPLARRIRSKTMVLVIPDNTASRDPFYHRAVVSATAVASTRLYGCAVFSEAPALDVITIEPLRVLSYDGIILFCPLLDWDAALQTITGRNIPVVLVRRASNIPGVVTISDSDSKGILLALEHLCGLGHRVIGFIGANVDAGSCCERKNAFWQGMTDRGLALDHAATINVAKTDHAGFVAHLQSLFSSTLQPTAFICDSDRIAALTIKVLDRMGKKVPADVSVTGYNNDYIAEVFNPAITSVSIPVESMVELGFRTLCDLAEGSLNTGVHIDVPNELKVRESTGPAVV